MPALMICQLKQTTENLNKIIMKKEITETSAKPSVEPIIIADECGDSMWEAVLEQPCIETDLLH